MTSSRAIARTAEFRTRLLRRLKRVFPDCAPEFIDADRGLAFRLVDERGRYRSNTVRIYVGTDGTLEAQRLRHLVHAAGQPEAGFPASLT